MATGAGQLVPVINFRRLRLEIGGFFMALPAGHRDMPSCQRKLSLLVSGQCECGWFVAFQIVTTVACIHVWGGGKLPSMLVTVAVSAPLEFDFE